VQPAAETLQERTERVRYPTGFVNEDMEAPTHAAQAVPAMQGAAEPVRPAVAPVQAPPVQAPPVHAAAAHAAPGLPKVQPFQLPVQDLVQVAESSGLQWVSSDAEKIAAAQAAMAAEPQPVRVPRERPAPIVVDEGPLVLVETKRDLSEMKLPFEQTNLPLQ
jgi:ribonuclease E